MSVRRVLSIDGVELTVREVKLARLAFRQGADFRALYCPCPGHATLCCDVAGEAKARYPLKVTRPRVVNDSQHSTGQWKVAPFDATTLGAELVLLWWRRSPVDEWEVARQFNSVSADRVALWADLFARPTEEVDAE